MKTGEHRTWFEVETGTVESVELCGGRAAYFSQRCPTRENTPNEDAGCVAQLSDQLGLLAIADGVGGANSGSKAAKVAIEWLVERAGAVDSKSGEGFRGHILDAIELANQDILGWGIGAGSTLAIVEYNRPTIRSFHVGDAKALLVSNRGRIKFATVGHAPIAMAVEIGLLEEEEALLHDDRNLISNCLGSMEMKIEIGPPIKMAARDCLVVASDGLFDNLTTEEIAAIIRTGELVEKTQRLVQLAIERMTGEGRESESGASPSKPDDLSIICFRQVK